MPFKSSITTGIEKDTLISKIFSFINHQLPAWRDDPVRPEEQSEKKLNLQLVKFLDAHARSGFPMVRFDHEEHQTGRRSVDMAASPVESITIDARLYTIYDPILVIEGKRLPAPSTDRECEYVTGGKDRVSGGIQRFKLGEHGRNLNVAAMVGYVQRHPLVYWYNKINEWIANLASRVMADSCEWVAGEKLNSFEEDSIKGTAKSMSLHSRQGRVRSSKISIHHFWVAMNIRETSGRQ